MTLILGAGIYAACHGRDGAESGAGGGVWATGVLMLAASGLAIWPRLRPGRTKDRQRRSGARDTELERLSRRLDLALDASRVGVWDLNVDTGELVWDARMEELYGYPPFDRPHRYTDWRDRLHPSDAARVEKEFHDAIAVGRYDSRFRLLLPGGVVRHIRAIAAVYDEEDGSSKVVGVNWDVTADIAHSAEIDARRREAEADSVAKSQFLATMSHEIRTPMNGVIGMLDLILRAEADPDQRERIVVARNSAGHLLSILNDVLDLSKLEANRITLEAADVNVHRLARDVVALMATGARDRDVEVTTRIGPAVPPWLVCDATRLRQVMLNLVGNAVKFTEVGGVELRLDYIADGRLEVAVTDTGVGIPEHALEQLFQRFSQVESPAGRRREGTGLGLAISREIVELMGGTIAVESMPGLGSTFRFQIPAPPAAEPTATVTARTSPPSPVPIRPARILVADDNATNRQVLAAYLGTGGHEVRMVSNGLEALTALHSGSFDLVILDVQMPVMDGITTARRIRAIPGPEADMPVIALTASAMASDREACLAAGMTDYVSKPVSLEVLSGAIARCLAYSPASSTWVQPSPGSKVSMAPATSRVSSPRSAS